MSPFDHVPPDKYFRVANGTAIRSLAELEGAIGAMSDETFGFHVNSSANHFAAWIRDIFCDENLASQVQNAREKKDVQIIVLRRVVELLKDGA